MWLGPRGAEEHPLADLDALVRREEGFTWLDVDAHPLASDTQEPGAELTGLLRAQLGIPADLAVEATQRSLIPRLRSGSGWLLLVLQSIDDAGHVFQMDQFISDKALVTVHSKFSTGSGLDAEEFAETDAVAAALLRGEAVAGSPTELAHAIGHAMAEHLERILVASSEAAGGLDRRMRERRTGDADRFLDELFEVRHDLVTIHNRAAQTARAFAAAGDHNGLSEHQGDLFADLRGRFDRLAEVCAGERSFLGEVLDFHEHRTNAKMNLAMERLALIAAVVLPINALAGVIGMNTIVNHRTDFGLTLLLVAVMSTMAGLVLWWTKRKQWW